MTEGSGRMLLAGHRKGLVRHMRPVEEVRRMRLAAAEPHSPAREGSHQVDDSLVLEAHRNPGEAHRSLGEGEAGRSHGAPGVGRMEDMGCGREEERHTGQAVGSLEAPVAGRREKRRGEGRLWDIVSAVHVGRGESRVRTR